MRVRNRLCEIAATSLQKGLRERGFDIGVTNTMVTPVFLEGELQEATAITMDLRENYGIFCSIVVYPVIPKGLIMLRLIPTALHTIEDVNRTLDAYSELAVKLKKGHYKEKSVLNSYFDTKVDVKVVGNGKGKITIPFQSEEDFNRILKLIKG